MSGRRARKDREEGLGKAEVKGRLAELGQTMHPETTLSYFERPSGPTNIIVLDRVSDYPKGELPEYCTHGYAECVTCSEMCFLGHETSKVVHSKEAVPLCRQCAAKHVTGTHPHRRVVDHLRRDGPH